MSRRTVLGPVGGLVLLALVFASLAGCSRSGDDGTAESVSADQAAAAASPRPGGRLVYGIEADPNGLDPTRNALDPVGMLVTSALFDTLTAFDADGKAEPYLAESVSSSPDFKTWSIKFRPNVKFHSGAPADLMAGAKNVQAMRDSLMAGPAAQYITSTGVGDGPLTGVINMSKPWATFPALLAGQGGYLVGGKQLDDDHGQIHPDGTGPFMLASWDIGKSIHLVRNPNYWRPNLPYLDALDFVVIPDGRERIAALKRGSVDVIAVSHLTDERELQRVLDEQKDAPAKEKLKVERDGGPSESTSIMFNTSKEPFDDLLARQAVAYATDKASLAAKAGWPTERLVDGPFPPDSPWYVPAAPPTYDLARARELVAAYERKHGKRLSFELLGSYEPVVLQELSRQWTAAGIDVKQNSVEFKKHVIMGMVGWYQAIQFRYFGAPDPDIFWNFWVSSTIGWKPPGATKPSPFSLNFSRLADDAVDDAVTRGRATDDLAERRQAYGDLQRRFAQLVPYIWLVRTQWIIATTNRVHDARNVTLPDGRPAMPFMAGVHRLTETWIEIGS